MSDITVKIIITLIGNEGLLDKPEDEYGVRNAEDSAKLCSEEIIKIGSKYKNYGWTAIVAEKSLASQTTRNL